MEYRFFLKRIENLKKKIKTGIFYTVLELAPKGEIFDYLSYGGPFNEKIARYYFRQMILALKHCHKAGFAHRDIKLENILLDGQLNLKLLDFGLSSHKNIECLRD